MQCLPSVHINTPGILICQPACCIHKSQTIDLAMKQYVHAWNAESCKGNWVKLMPKSR